MGDKDCDAIAAQSGAEKTSMLSHGLTSKDDKDSHVKQPLKILATLSRIARLELTASKTELLRNSIFYTLSQVNYERECGASLILALRECFDAKSNTFKFNNNASLRLCSKEAATVLGMEDRGKDFNPSDYHSNFPQFLVEQTGGSAKVTGPSLKKILSKMVLKKFTDSDSELQFKKVLIFFIIDQFLIASSNKHPRCSLWGLVEDLDVAEAINWPKATLELIYEELARLDVVIALSKGQTMGAAFPLLEVMVFERISVLQPSLHTSVSPLLQKYKTSRLKLKDWRQKLRELMPENISPCEFCDKDVKEGVGEAVNVGVGEALLEMGSCAGSPCDTVLISKALGKKMASILISDDDSSPDFYGVDEMMECRSPTIHGETSGDAIVLSATKASVSSTTERHRSDSLTTKFEGFDIRSDLVPTLQKIWQKHGNIIKDSTMHSVDIVARGLESLATMVRILEDNPAQSLSDGQADYLSSTLSNLKGIHFKVCWLVLFVEKALLVHKSKPLVESLNNLNQLNSEVEEDKAILLDKLAKLYEKQSKLKEEIVKVSKMIPFSGQVKFDKPIGAGLA